MVHWCIALLVALAAADPDHVKVHILSPKNQHGGDNEMSQPTEDGNPTAGSIGLVSPNISYHGGPIVVTPSVHIIFYGAWGTGVDNGGKQIITDFITNLGGSPWMSVIAGSTHYPAYSDDTGATVTGRFGTLYNQDVGLNPNLRSPYNLGSGDVWTIVSYYVTHYRRSVYDSNALYVVLSSSTVNQTNGGPHNGFCTAYCGWHSYQQLTNNQIIKFAWIGNPAHFCQLSCGAQSTGPNGNAGADAMVSVIAHEIIEMTTDPQLSAWFDSNGWEDGDKCAWTFGSALYTKNGASANMHLGTRDFLVQRSLALNNLCYVNGVTFQQ